MYSIEEILEATHTILNKNLSTSTPIKEEIIKNDNERNKLNSFEVNQLNAALSALTEQLIYSSTNSLSNKIFKNI